MLHRCLYSFLGILIIFNIVYVIKCDKNENIPRQSIRSVDLRRTDVFGPGLQPDKIVLPVRYFYIYPRDTYGNR